MQASGKNHFLIDGFPRNKDNVDGWQKAMDGKVQIQCVLFLDCNETVTTTDSCFYLLMIFAFE